jgi:hypothetical protein
MSSEERSAEASRALLIAALGGLLGFTEACVSSSPASTSQVGAFGADTPVPATACATGVIPNPQVTSTMMAVLSQDQFVAQCNARHGIYELQPGCGGSNSCRGMSYDATTQTLSEHTCRSTNTCGGYSCVICS